MSYIALYRKWRPLVFEDVVEQKHVVEALKNSVKMQRVSHAYLFCGTRGTGKTTVARIFSRAINCLSPKDGDPCNECEICKGILAGGILDVVEIDAASNNSVDNIRNIRDEVVYAPSRAKYKVYIIDEVHMLSTGAFNALLKTLEEPPAHAVFFLATTEPHKLPATILSRCQRFDFRRISAESIAKRLTDIAEASDVSIDTEAALFIAKISEGALRDAITLLDQCMSRGGEVITRDDVANIAGLVNLAFTSELVDALSKRDVGAVIKLIDELVMSGKDISAFVSELIQYYRNLMICAVSPNPEDIVNLSRSDIECMKKQLQEIKQDFIMLAIRELSLLESSLKWSNHPRIMLEVGLIKICRFDFNLDKDDLLERLQVLEMKVENGLIDTLKSDVEIENKNIKPSINNMETKTGYAHLEGKPIKKTGDFPSKSKKGEDTTALQGKLVNGWDEIVTEIKKLGRVSLYAYLQGAKAYELDDNLIGIVFDEGGTFKKPVVSKTENIEVIESIAAKKLDKPVRVKCVDSASYKRNEVYDKKDEFVEKAKNIADKLNIPLNIIDE